MGSYISIYNNTKDTYLVKVGPDEAAMRIAGIVTAVLGALATIIATAGAAAPVTSAMVASGVVSVFGVSTNVLAAVTGLAASISTAATVGVTVTSWATSAALFISEQIMTDGFVEILPGQKHTFGKYSLSLWRQGTCRRVRVNPNNAEEVETDVLYMRPIFSGATAESVLEHNIQFWIDKWGHESREVVTLHKENFSASSQNIQFEDGKLSARCRASDGQWHDASLDINHYYTNVDGIVQAAVEKPGNFMSTCSDLELQGSVLRGMAETRDKRKVEFELDLDIDIANKEGKLVPLTS